MNPQLFAIIDDREPPLPELERLIGDIHFGDILRRRRRYLDELVAAAAGADDVTVLRTDEEAEQLIRRIEAARGDTLWLRLPVVIAPLDMSRLDFLIRKTRYALEPVLLGPVFEDDAPMVLFPRDAVTLLAASTRKERRSQILRIAEDAPTAVGQLEFMDLRQADSVLRFLSGATEPRAFNKLTVDEGVFVKGSSDIAKMRAEHGFFELASPNMRRFLLPTFGFEEHGGTAYYRMEHLRIPDAALQFVLGSFTETHFEQLLDQFFAFIKVRDQEPIGHSGVHQRGQAQITQKMHDRLETFLTNDIGKRVDGVLQASGIKDGIRGLERRATPMIEDALANHKADHLAFSHGDPCLSNILFDSRIGMIRLIDPRGATLRDDALLHPLYDVAKFSHSILGGYDFVNNGLFSIEVDATLGLDLRRHRGGAPDWVRDTFKDRLEREGWTYSQVRAVEASLFLSMLPLHLDHENKLLGFALIAQEIIEELERSNG